MEGERKSMAEKTKKMSGKALSVGMILLKLRTLIALLAVFIVFSIMAPNLSLIHI